MNKNPIETAQNMIELGKKTKNQKLITIGEELLKKHQSENFVTTTRKPIEESRIKYDENGNQVGIIGRKEPVSVKNMKFVEDKTVAADKADEILKKTTVHVPRREKAVDAVATKCYICGRTEMVHPSHVREFYRCNKCSIRRI